MDEKEKQQLFVTLENIRMQVDRLLSDIESEKESRKRRNDDFDKRIRTLEDWKSETKGKVSIVNVIVMAIISLAIYIILWLITKK